MLDTGFPHTGDQISIVINNNMVMCLTTHANFIPTISQMGKLVLDVHFQKGNLLVVDTDKIVMLVIDKKYFSF